MRMLNRGEYLDYPHRYMIGIRNRTRYDRRGIYLDAVCSCGLAVKVTYEDTLTIAAKPI